MTHSPGSQSIIRFKLRSVETPGPGDLHALVSTRGFDFVFELQLHFFDEVDDVIEYGELVAPVGED